MSDIRATGTLNATVAGPDPMTMTAVEADTVSPTEKDSCATTPSIGEVIVALARLACAWLRAVCACPTWAWAVATLTDDPEEPAEPPAAPEVPDAEEVRVELDEEPDAPAKDAIEEASRDPIEVPPDPAVEVFPDPLVDPDPPVAVLDPPIWVPDPVWSDTEHCCVAALSARACCATLDSWLPACDKLVSAFWRDITATRQPVIVAVGKVDIASSVGLADGDSEGSGAADPVAASKAAMATTRISLDPGSLGSSEEVPDGLSVPADSSEVPEAPLLVLPVEVSDVPEGKSVLTPVTDPSVGEEDKSLEV